MVHFHIFYYLLTLTKILILLFSLHNPCPKTLFSHQFLSYYVNLVVRMVYFNGKGLKNEDLFWTLKYVIFAVFRFCKKLTEFHKFILFEKLESGIIAHFKGNYVPMKIL